MTAPAPTPAYLPVLYTGHAHWSERRRENPLWPSSPIAFWFLINVVFMTKPGLILERRSPIIREEMENMRSLSASLIGTDKTHDLSQLRALAYLRVSSRARLSETDVALSLRRY